MLSSPRRPPGGLVEDGASAWGKVQGDGSSNATVWLQKQLRAWDKGPRAARIRMVEEFVLQNKGIFAVDLEKKYGNGASLFCLRLSAWLRLSAIAQQSTALPLRALSVFLYSAQGSRFALELMETGGLQPVFDILNNEYAREEETHEALLFLRGLTLHGQTVKEYLSRQGAIRLAASYLTSNRPEEILELAASLLLDLGTANPLFFPEAYAALLAALTGCQRTSSLLLAGHTFRMLVAPAINKSSGLDVLLGEEHVSSFNGEASHSTLVTESAHGPQSSGLSSPMDVMQTRYPTKEQAAENVSCTGDLSSNKKVASHHVPPKQDGTKLLQNRLGLDATLAPLHMQRDSDNVLWKLSRTGHTPTRTPYNSPQAVEAQHGTFSAGQLDGLKEKLNLEEENLVPYARKFRDADALLREGVICGMRLLQTPHSKVQFEAFEILRTLGSIGNDGMSIVMNAVSSCLVEGEPTEKPMGPEVETSETTPRRTPLGIRLEEGVDKELTPHSGKGNSELILQKTTKESLNLKSAGSANCSSNADDEERGEGKEAQELQSIFPAGHSEQFDSSSPCQDGMQHLQNAAKDQGINEQRADTPSGVSLNDNKQVIVDENGNESFDDVASAYTIRGNPITTIDISPKKVSYISCSPRRSPNRPRPSVMTKPTSAAPVESALEKAISRELSIRNLWSRGNFQKRAELLSQAHRLLENEEGEGGFELAWGKGYEKSKPSGREQKSDNSEKATGGHGEEEVVSRHPVDAHRDEVISEDGIEMQKLAAAKFLGLYVERSSGAELAAASLVEGGLVRALLICLKLAMNEHQLGAPDCSTRRPGSEECSAIGSHRLVVVVMRTLQYLLSISDLVKDFVRHVAGEEVLVWLRDRGGVKNSSPQGEKGSAILDHLV